MPDYRLPEKEEQEGGTGPVITGNQRHNIWINRRARGTAIYVPKSTWRL